jgi:hypothetical protein
VAEAVRLVVGGLHLCGMGKCGEEEESSAARMSNNGTKEPIFIAASSDGRARVARIYASPCSDATPRCAAAQSCAGAVIRCGRRDDELSVLSLTVGHAVSPPPPWIGFGSGVPAPDEEKPRTR